MEKGTKMVIFFHGQKIFRGDFPIMPKVPDLTGRSEPF